MAVRIHVGDSSDDGATGGVLDALADSKVSDFNFSLGIEEDVFGLDIAVDGVPGVVDVVEAVEDLSREGVTLKMIVAISSSERTSFLTAISWMMFLRAPMSMNSITCLTSPSWKKQV